MESFWKYFNVSAGFFRPFSSAPNLEPATAENVTFTFLEENVTSTTPANVILTTNVSVIDNVTSLFVSNQTSEDELPWGAKGLLICMYTFAAMFAIVGNVTVITVFSIGKRSKSDLRLFLINLAVADLIMAIFCMPFTFTPVMLGYWIFSAPMCPIVMFMQIFAVTASVSTNTAIGIDRFVAVTYPLKHIRLTKSKSKIIVSVIWIIAFGCAAVQIFIARVEPYEDGGTYGECKEMWTNAALETFYSIFILTLTYLLPLSILTITYSIIARRLWTRTAPGNADQARDAAQLKSKRKVVKMLMIVVVLFALCWLPLQVFILVVNYSDLALLLPEKMLKIIYYIVHYLAMSNSFQNPIIYGFMNNQFRHDLCELCGKWFPCCRWMSCIKKARARSSFRVFSQVSKHNNNGSEGSTANDTTEFVRISTSPTSKCRNGSPTRKLQNGSSGKDFQRPGMLNKEPGITDKLLNKSGMNGRSIRINMN